MVLAGRQRGDLISVVVCLPVAREPWFGSRWGLRPRANKKFTCGGLAAQRPAGPACEISPVLEVRRGKLISVVARLPAAGE